MKVRLLAVAFAAIVAACGSVAGSGGTPSPTPPANTVTVTRASNQQTVTAHVGDHIMSALIGTAVSLPFEEKKLLLGTWQRVVLIELDGRVTVPQIVDARDAYAGQGTGAPMNRGGPSWRP